MHSTIYNVQIERPDAPAPTEPDMAMAALDEDEVFEMAEGCPFYADYVRDFDHAREKDEMKQFADLFGDEGEGVEISGDGCAVTLTDPEKAGLFLKTTFKTTFEELKRIAEDLTLDDFIGGSNKKDAMKRILLGNFDSSVGYILNGNALLTEGGFLEECRAMPKGTVLRATQAFDYHA